MNTTEPDLPEDNTTWTRIEHFSDAPDYATRLRDEVAMRCFLRIERGIYSNTEAAMDAAMDAFDEAEAFMAERKRVEGAE